MNRPLVHILDLNTGNVGSVAKAFTAIGAEVKIVRTKTDLENATHLVLPGIGHFGTAMERFVQLDLLDSVLQYIREDNAFLGICLGMQLLSGFSEEGNCKGLGIFNAQVKQLSVPDTIHFKIPHNGWNTLKKVNDCPLLENISETDEFFFLHKFAWHSSNQSEVIALTEYGIEFPTVIGRHKCWGVQFHPEKSHESGRKLLSNFLKL